MNANSYKALQERDEEIARLRVALEACAVGTEILVTSEMVSAGIAELFPCVLRPYQDEVEVLGRVFQAMARLSPDFQSTS